MGEFYVYLHRRADNGKTFYIGKGKGRRAFRSAGRSERWQRVAAKYGFMVEIIFQGSEEDCFAIERTKIAQHRSEGSDLVNFNDGGEGSANPSPDVRVRLSSSQKARFADPANRASMSAAKSTPEQKERQSAARRAAMSSPDARAAVSAAMRKVWARRKATGAVIFTPEVKAKLSAAQTARWARDGEREKQRAAQLKHSAIRAEALPIKGGVND